MDIENMNDDQFDHINGPGRPGPCANCESYPQELGSLFCSDKCRLEYEGEDDDD